MTIETKLFSFIITAIIIPIITLFAGLWYKIKRSDERILTMQNIIFLEKGGLNIVTNDVLTKAVSDIEKSIQREADISAKVLERLECLDYNVIELMVKSNLKPKRVRKTGNPVNVYKQISEE